MSSLFRGVHNILDSVFTPHYQDAVYIETRDLSLGTNAEPEIVQIRHEGVKVQIDTGSRGQRGDSGVSVRGGQAKILVDSLDVKPKAQDQIEYTPINDPTICLVVTGFIGTDPVNTYYKINVAR